MFSVNGRLFCIGLNVLILLIKSDFMIIKSYEIWLPGHQLVSSTHLHSDITLFSNGQYVLHLNKFKINS